MRKKIHDLDMFVASIDGTSPVVGTALQQTMINYTPALEAYGIAVYYITAEICGVTLQNRSSIYRHTVDIIEDLKQPLDQRPNRVLPVVAKIRRAIAAQHPDITIHITTSFIDYELGLE